MFRTIGIITLISYYEKKNDDLMTNRTTAHSDDSCRPNLIFSLLFSENF